MTRKSRSVERDFLFQTIMEQIAIQGIAGCYHETAARGYAPTFICESAGTQAEDARMMMDLYKKETEK